MNHESDLCTNVSERLCLLAIWHCCEVTKHMHASMPNASFNALLRSNCLRFRRWVFNICMRKKTTKNNHGMVFWIWLFVTFNFHPTLQMTSYLHPSPTWFRFGGLPCPFHDPTGNRGQGRFKTNSRGSFKGNPSSTSDRLMGWGWFGCSKRFSSPPQNLLEERWTPLKSYDMFQVKILECVKAIGQFYMVWYFFSQSRVYMDMIFLVPKASTWFLRNGMTSIKISIFVIFWNHQKPNTNWH